MTIANWFDVDRAGLAQLMAGRSKAFVIYELLQNAWDQNVSRVDVTVEPAPGRRAVRVIVADDDPQGFTDLAQAYTLFAESTKKANPEQRGRFDIGEKLVLALAIQARVESTTGSVVFDRDGRHQLKDRRKRGSAVEAEFAFMRAEYEEILSAVRRVIAPVPTYLNGERLAERKAIDEFAHAYRRRCWRAPGASAGNRGTGL